MSGLKQHKAFWWILVTALWAERVKRDAGYNKEFILAALGVEFGINTLNLQPDGRRKSLLLIPNEEVHPISSEWNSRSSDVFDNGDAVYGFFTMSVVYTLTHSDRSSLGNNIYSFKEEGWLLVENRIVNFFRCLIYQHDNSSLFHHSQIWLEVNDALSIQSYMRFPKLQRQ